jgi:hypothetical protein
MTIPTKLLILIGAILIGITLGSGVTYKIEHPQILTQVQKDQLKNDAATEQARKDTEAQNAANQKLTKDYDDQVTQLKDGYEAQLLAKQSEVDAIKTQLLTSNRRLYALVRTPCTGDKGSPGAATRSASGDSSETYAQLDSKVAADLTQLAADGDTAIRSFNLCSDYASKVKEFRLKLTMGDKE